MSPFLEIFVQAVEAIECRIEQLELALKAANLEQAEQEIAFEML
jgi:hypothetical protein